jgi:hypothetical protein
MTNKNLNFDDNLSFDSTEEVSFDDVLELIKDPEINLGLSGAISSMTDNTGRVCFKDRCNLIVLRGRTFSLEKLFNTTIDSNGVNSGAVPYISDLNRQILGFGVGYGGAPSGDPFSPYSVPPTGDSGVALTQPIPFRLHDTSQSASGNGLLYVPSNEITNYGDLRSVSGSQYHYYMKLFDSPPVWVFNAAANTVYKQILLSISVNDCRTTVGHQINELCLYFGRNSGHDVYNGNVITHPEMFSKITFPTENISGSKTLSIVYNIYA